MALMGFDRLDRSETTPKLTSICFRRPSHNNETVYGVFNGAVQ